MVPGAFVSGASVVMVPQKFGCAVTSGGWEVMSEGSEVTREGIPVMTPSELVMVVYDVKGFVYAHGCVGACGWPSDI